MKLLNTIRILSGALFISLCCLTASCNFLEIVPVEQADLDDAGLYHSQQRKMESKHTHFLEGLIKP